MRICLICVEIFAWGKYGGFGRATRIIGRELAKRGIEVFAVVPRRRGQKPFEELDGINVLSFPPFLPWLLKELFRKCDADIYHSQEPSFGTYLAMKTMPERMHLVTLRDPKTLDDWKKEFLLPSRNKLRVFMNSLYEDNFLVRKAVKRADKVFCASKHLVAIAKKKYGLDLVNNFLPTPVFIPNNVQKSTIPIVCFLGRWDRRKRPELFFELVAKYPEVKFMAIGSSQDKKWENHLRKAYINLPNLEFTGFVDQFSSDLHSKILDKSWILVNTSTREGLPNSFLEAAAYRCSILSAVDPDGFASKFGYHAKNDDFKEGLDFLLEQNRWVEKGFKGYEYVKETFELNKAVDKHIHIYEQMLKN